MWEAGVPVAAQERVIQIREVVPLCAEHVTAMGHQCRQGPHAVGRGEGSNLRKAPSYRTRPSLEVPHTAGQEAVINTRQQSSVTQPTQGGAARNRGSKGRH